MSTKVRILWQKIFGDFHLRYIPPLAVYFAFGASSFSAVAISFWEKKYSGLSPEFIAGIAFWAGLPWAVKMIFGQFADSVEIFGSRRKSYLVLGAGVIASSQYILIELAKDSSWLLGYGSLGSWYLLSGVMVATGFMIQDVIADTMTTEVVVRVDPKSGEHLPKDLIDKELGHVQWLGRLVMMLSAAFGMLLGGLLAKNFEYHTVFTIALFIPAISLVGILCPDTTVSSKSVLNRQVLVGGMVLALFIIATGLFRPPHKELTVLVVSLAVITVLIARLGVTKPVVCAAAVIFLFRATPGAGPAVSWWQMDVFGFDEEFFGSIGSFAGLLAIAGLLFLRKPIIEKPIRFTLFWLTLALALVGIPNVGLYYGMHEWLGMSAKTFVWFDTAVSAPLGQLSMVPLLTLTAKTCPSGKEGTWFALVASLMNLAFSASALGTKYLYKVFEVSQEIRDKTGVIVTVANYENIGTLLIIAWVIGLVVPLTAILIFLRKTEI